VPDCLVDLVHSFYDGIAATVLVSGVDAPPFEVRNGCTIAPTLFILYFEHTLGIEVLGGKLVGERLSSFQLSKSLFADDAVLICTLSSDMVTAANVFEEVTLI